jgi:sec-independent protein translocase protein TatA
MFGTGEILIILCVILILFGGKKLPEFAKYLGQGIREFKKACQGIEEDDAIEKSIIEERSSETIVVEAKHDDSE